VTIVLQTFLLRMLKWIRNWVGFSFIEVLFLPGGVALGPVAGLFLVGGTVLLVLIGNLGFYGVIGIWLCKTYQQWL
jgi:hypothetical protein